MKATLEHILQAVLEGLHYGAEEWEQIRSSRRFAVVAAKQLFCLVASEVGYTKEEIGRFIHMRPATVGRYIDDFKTRVGPGVIEEAQKKLSKYNSKK